ncbi:hypothetical protein [Microbacterium sp. P04]|uniref:hypothetical protein n=1 Tax=Microbacterium sp. P04 TaxID=3366947 RepID=UPI003746F9EA
MATEAKHENDDEMPTRDELVEPSTEKAPGNEPKAKENSQPEADHEAVGIGVVGRPQVDDEAGA